MNTSIIERLQELRYLIYTDSSNSKLIILENKKTPNFIKSFLDNFGSIDPKPLMVKENNSKINYFVEKILAEKNLNSINKFKLSMVLKKILGFDFSNNLKQENYDNKKRLYNVVEILNRYPSLSKTIIVKNKEVDKNYLKIYNSLKIKKPTEFIKSLLEYTR